MSTHSAHDMDSMERYTANTSTVPKGPEHVNNPGSDLSP